MFQIKVLCFGKYNTFFIFRDTVSPTYRENHDTKISKRLSWFKVKNYHNVMRILFFIKTVMLLPS